MQIAVNDVNFPSHIQKGYNPYAVGLIVIGNEYGARTAVWASSAQNTLDTAVDLNQLDCLLDENQTCDYDDLVPLGNADELFDLSHVWVGVVDFQLPRDFELMKACILAEDDPDSNFLE